MLKEHINSLPADQQFKLAVKLIRLTLPIWYTCSDKNKLAYIDAVAGLPHSVDRRLLSVTADYIEKRLPYRTTDDTFFQLHSQFTDPIVALQDEDWELPGEVCKLFYAVHNLAEAFMDKTQTTFGDLTIYVSINQALDALTTSGQMPVEQLNAILADFSNSR